MVGSGLEAKGQIMSSSSRSVCSPAPTMESSSFHGLKGSQDRGVRGPDPVKAEDRAGPAFLGPPDLWLWMHLHLAACPPGCQPPGLLPAAISIVIYKAGSLLMGVINGIG